MLVFGNCNVTKIATSMEAMISSVDACATRQCKAVRRSTYTKPNIVGIRYLKQLTKQNIVKRDTVMRFR